MLVPVLPFAGECSFPPFTPTGGKRGAAAWQRNCNCRRGGEDDDDDTTISGDACGAGRLAPGCAAPAGAAWPCLLYRFGRRWGSVHQGPFGTIVVGGGLLKVLVGPDRRLRPSSPPDEHTSKRHDTATLMAHIPHSQQSPIHTSTTRQGHQQRRSVDARQQGSKQASSSRRTHSYGPTTERWGPTLTSQVRAMLCTHAHRGFASYRSIDRLMD